jgi:hypothetical protein
VSLVLGSLALLILLSVPATALAANAVRTPANYNSNLIPRGDDTYSSVVNLPFTMNWNGTVYTTIYINMNGNCTFGNFFTAYDPATALTALNRDILAPFWADVDTTNVGSNQVTYSNITSGNVPQVDGHNAFMVNWIGVPRYNAQTTPLNTFQLILIDRSDTGAGNFDIEYNYNTITWDRGTAASNAYARAGWGRAGPTGYEITGGNTNGAYLDTGARALVDGSLNSGGVLGRYVWSVRNGVPPNSPPIINLAFETLNRAPNGPRGRPGYRGAGAATASDPDGNVVTFVRAPAIGTFLPMGSNTVTWTATDNGGLVSVDTQTIIVADTLPPTLPVVVSTTHSVSTWTTVGTVGLRWTSSVDAGTGVDGYSYGWTPNAPGLPDTTRDAYTTGAGVPVTVTLENETFPDNNWPADLTRPAGDSQTYLRANNFAGRNHGTSAAEVYSNNNTRRNVSFSKIYDLSGCTSASLSFWDYSVQIEAGDYNTVEYSTDGTNWTVLQTRAGNAVWTQRTYGIPVGSSTVTIRFSGSVNANNEYVCWDDVLLTAVASTTNSHSSDPGDGRWYFNVRAVDAAGNWTATASSVGPIWIDRVAPTTTSNIPAGWINAPLSVTLSAADPSGVVASTSYRINAGATTLYTVPFNVSAEGATTVQFWSTDGAGNVEVANTATVRIDRFLPTVPSGVVASAVGSSTIDVTWNASTDAASGIAYYRVYQDGALVATTTMTTFSRTGLSPGQTCTFRIAAVDAAGNASAQSAPASATVPLASLWLDISSATVDFNALQPGTPATLTGAEIVGVNGVGAIGYDLTCAASDFHDTGTGTLTIPIGSLTFVTRGWVTSPARAFSTSTITIDSGVDGPALWRHAYIFDYTMSVPWDSDVNTYSTSIVYTAVAK